MDWKVLNEENVFFMLLVQCFDSIFVLNRKLLKSFFLSLDSEKSFFNFLHSKFKESKSERNLF